MVRTDDQLRLAETIVYQAAAAIRRAHLLSQAEEARQEAERLFALSAALNAAQGPDDIVHAVVASGLVEEPSLVSLSMVEADADGRPRWSIVMATYTAHHPKDISQIIGPGHRFHLPDRGSRRSGRPAASRLLHRCLLYQQRSGRPFLCPLEGFPWRR